MPTKKIITAIPASGHPTITHVYVLQIKEENPDVLLVHTEIPQGSFKLLSERGHLKEIFPVDYSKYPVGALPNVLYYEVL